MREGYWINYRTGKEFLVDEHERWLREPDNARRLGLSSKVADAIPGFEPVEDREKMILFVMQHAPVMRVRGHGNYATFEYASRARRDPIEAIWMWGLRKAGDYTGMYIVNFATGEKTSTYWKDFKQAMEIGGASEVMRVATSEPAPLREIVAKELLDLSRELIGEPSVPRWDVVE